MASNLPQSEWTFSRVTGGYITECKDLGIKITAEEISRKADGMTALMTVRSTMVGLRTVEDDILKIGLLNFYAPTSRSSWAKQIAARCPGEAQQLDWDGYLERFVANVIASERLGDPAVDLADVPLVDKNHYLIPGLVSSEETTIWFGDGGSMKSYLALAALATVATGSSAFLGVEPSEQRNVGYVDWEWGSQAHRRRLGRLAQGKKLPRIHYIRCDRPLVNEVPRLQRLIRELDLGFLVLDSVVFGCDGPAEQSDTAGRYFMALRQLAIPSLLIAHVTKAEDGDKKPFGSSFWHNSARLTWYIRKSGEFGEQTIVGLFNRKNNDDRPLEPRAFRFWFQDEMLQTIISPASMDDLANEPDIAEKMPLKARIAASVKYEPKTISEIAVEIGRTVQDVSTTIRREEKQGRTFTRVQGPDQVYRIALLETRDEPLQ